jgi:signal transduction histidine kinase/FixJ family two-component response regulator
MEKRRKSVRPQGFLKRLKISIHVKVLLIIISIVAVITLSSLVSGFWYSQKRLLETVENDMRLMGRIAAQMIANEIALLKEETRTVAAHLRGASPEDIAETLRIFAEDSRFRDMAVLDTGGKIVYYGQPLLLEDEHLTNPHTLRAFAGETVLGNPTRDPSGELVIRIWTPLDDGRALAAILPGLYFSDFVAEFRIWQTGSIFILDNTGKFVGHWRTNLVSEELNYIELGKTDPAGASAGRFFETMIQGGSGVGYYTFNGKERLCAYMPIAGSDGFVLGVAAPTAESPLTQLRWVLLVASGIFLGLGILAAFLAADSIAIPIEQIKDQNMRLEELKRNAESASETKSQFLANMSHEMRTPLNAIIGLSELELGGGDLAENTYDNVEKIYISGMTLLGIINDILDISKIEAGKFTLIPAEYNVPSVINDTITLNVVRIGSKPVKFRLHIDETMPDRLIGDELRVKQVFNNLLSNAFKYTREGTVDWYISAEVYGNDVWLSSRVVDTGIGIREEDLSRLFGEYNQLDAKSNRRIEGTGLGLSITKRMVELMDGEISVESQYGKGSAFSVRLRQGYVNDTVIGREVAENLRGFHFTAHRRTANEKLVRAYLPYATVLVVDDVVVNLDVAKGMLRPYGMTVDCVTSGQKAIDLIRTAKVKYDAVFMDHMMPGIDGIEATRIIRHEIGTEYARTVPIIAFTANAIVGSDNLFLQNGFQAFLSKPIDIMRLDVIINQWIRNRELEKGMPPKQELVPAANGRTLQVPAELAADGFNFARGLRIFGDELSYMDVIRSFIDHTPAMFDTIRNIVPDRLPEYGAAMHSIKGAAYGICADVLGKKAEELEHAAKAGDIDFVRSHSESFLALAGKLIRDLGGFLETSGADQGKPKKAAPDEELLARALEASIRYDIDALDRIITELEQYTYESRADLVPWLREQSRKSEFEAIRKKLTGEKE